MAQIGKEGLTSYNELLKRKDAVATGLAKIDFIAGQIQEGTFNPGRTGQFSRNHLRSLPFEQKIEAGVRIGKINQRLQDSAKPTLQSSSEALASLQDRVQGIIDLVANGHLPQSFLDDIFAESETKQVVVIEEPMAAVQENIEDNKRRANEASVLTQRENNRKRLVALDRVVTTIQNPQSSNAITKEELAEIALATGRMNNFMRGLSSPQEKWEWVKRQISYPTSGIMNGLRERFQTGNVIEPEDRQLIAHIQSVMKERGVPTQDVQTTVEYFVKTIVPEWVNMQGQSEDVDLSPTSFDEPELSDETPVNGRRERDRSVLIGKYEQYANERAAVLLRILRQEPVAQDELVNIIYATSLQPLRYRESEDQGALRWEVARGLIEAQYREAILPAMAKRFNEGKAPEVQVAFMNELLGYVHQATGVEVTPIQAVNFFRREVFGKWADRVSKGQEVEAVDELLMEMKQVTEEYEQMYGERLIIE